MSTNYQQNVKKAQTQNHKPPSGDSEGPTALDYASDFEDVRNRTKNAIMHMETEYHPEFVKAELYEKGNVDIPTVEGRSSLVQTEVADAIRGLMPSVMRTLMHGRKPVEYSANTMTGGDFAEQQSLYLSQFFLANGGYRILYDAIQTSFKTKAGPIKTYWVQDANPEYISATGLSLVDLLQYQNMDGVEVISYEPETNGDHDNESLPTSEDSITYSMTALRSYSNGKLMVQTIPIEDFFVEEGATKLDDAVHGHTSLKTVSELIEMGLNHDWDKIAEFNPNEVGKEVKDARSDASTDRDQPQDTLSKRILVTETYCLADIEDNGYNAKYLVIFIGNNYEYAHHERIEDFEIDLLVTDPIPNLPLGKSYYDIGKAGQDAQTALLRMMMDNAAQANNPRPIGDPTNIDFNDLMNNAIGAPIKRVGSAPLDYVDTPFTAGNLLPFMGYLEKSSEKRSGVTKASTGLDPDAMQSTDKDAVRNTIVLGQGQVELYVRNAIETGIIPLFKRLLRLSIRHMDKSQIIQYRGKLVEVDTSMFNPDWAAEPAVGLGTSSPEEKIATLQMVLGHQKDYMIQFGMDNPFTSLEQIHNTMSDMVTLGGLKNVGRYFNHITPDIEKQIAANMAKAQQEAAANQQQPTDPASALFMTEMMRNKSRNMTTMVDMRIKERQLQLEAMIKAEELDLKRDQMAQERVFKFSEINRPDLSNEVKDEQELSRPNNFARVSPSKKEPIKE